MNTSLPQAVGQRPPQFGLRTVFVCMTVLSALFALFVAVGPTWSAGLILFASLIGLHIIGNALGTRLQEQRLQRLADANQDDDDQPPESLVAPTMAPARRLQENTALRRPWLVAAAVSATVFGSVGGIIIALLVGNALTIPGLALGIASSAILGGFFGFMVCSLWSVARMALREALDAADPDSPSET